MRLIYSGLIMVYGMILQVAALFNTKAKLWVGGRRGLFENLRVSFAQIDRTKNPVAWFHVSSLGEFEQGRPVIEAFRKQWPQKKILLTFFSPSGYLVRKNYDQADFVFYMPLDTPGNARNFLDIVQPEMVFFVKYDFWFNFMKGIHDRKIPLYFVSALFRRDQHFFQWHGGWSRRNLAFVTRFFVQNKESESLLKNTGIGQVTIAGDTRFDRVYALSAVQTPMPLVEKFCSGHPVLVAGSTWEPDEALLMPLINDTGSQLKFIIAPHDTSPARISHIRGICSRPVICLSELDENNATEAGILLIDSVGILSRLYRYAKFAYIGGGFGGGIHNIQEPVTFGVPVFFGPNYHKFSEARDLVSLGGAMAVTSSEELAEKLVSLNGNEPEYTRLSAICRNYVSENRGATEKIITHLLK